MLHVCHVLFSILNLNSYCRTFADFILILHYFQFYSIMIKVARSREKGCADRAKFLLDEMGRLYNEGDEDLVPDALTFGAIINAVSQFLQPCDNVARRTQCGNTINAINCTFN